MRASINSMKREKSSPQIFVLIIQQLHLIKLLVCLTRFLPDLESLHFVSRPLFTPRLFFHPWALLPTCFLSQPSYISSSDQAIVLGLRIFTCWQLRPREELIMRIIAAKMSITTTLYNLWCYIHQRRHFFQQFSGFV